MLHKIKTVREAKIVIIGAIMSFLYPIVLPFAVGGNLFVSEDHPSFWDNIIMVGGFIIIWYPLWIIYYLKAKKFLKENG